MARKITAFVLARLKQWEGLRLNAYQDSAGVWTVGYGHTGPDVRRGLTITTARAEALLLADLARFEAAVDGAVTVPLTDNQFGALVSFAFNVGEAAFRKSTLLKRLNAGRHDDVPAQLARWVHAGGKRVQGLVNRRAAEAGLWASGSFVSSAPVAAAPATRAAYLTGENVAVAGTVASSLAAASASSGPLQYALAAVLVVATVAAAFFVIQRVRE